MVQNCGISSATMNQNLLLTRDEVAKILKVCRHTIQRYTRKGLLPALHLNQRVIRYRQEDVESFLAQAETKREMLQR